MISLQTKTLFPDVLDHVVRIEYLGMVTSLNEMSMTRGLLLFYLTVSPVSSTPNAKFSTKKTGNPLEPVHGMTPPPQPKRSSPTQ